MPQLAAKVCPGCGARYDAEAEFCQLDGQRLEDNDPYIGRTLLDQFVIEEALGAGGMGTVYRAHQTTVERNVAIKILHPELATDPDAVRRFRREARVSSELEHPNIVRVYLFGQLPGEDSLYLVMQYLDGRPLSDVVRGEGALSLRRALHIVTQICDGIGDAHAHGVVHRDVKPENVLLIERAGDPDFVKVLDFGIARFLEGEQTVATQSGLIFGTARYISPEAASGEPTDARSDVYSIAVLAYQLLAGRTPFDSRSPVSLLMKHLHEAPPPLAKLPGCDHIPPRVADLIMRSLAKRPDARPMDGNELGTALREAAHDAGVDLSLPSMFRRSAPSTGGGRRVTSAANGRTTAPTDPIAAAGGGTESSTDPTDASASMSFLKPRRSWGALWTLAIAFVIGALAVGAVAWALSHPWGEGAVRARVESLEHEARAALARGSLDAPPGANVRELTDELLELDEGYRPAFAIRREAARRLREEANTAKDQGFVAEATALFGRALVFDPNDRIARTSLAELTEAPPREEALESSLRLSTERARIGATVRFAATTVEPVAEARFLIRAGRRTVATVPARKVDGLGHRWEGSRRFRTAARYTIRLEAEGLEEPLETRLVVRRSESDGPAVTHAPAPRTGGPTMASPAVNSHVDDGIDWRIPGGSPRERPPTISRPPSMAESRPGGMSDPPEPTSPPTPTPSPEGPPAPWSSGSVL